MESDPELCAVAPCRLRCYNVVDLVDHLDAERATAAKDGPPTNCAKVICSSSTNLATCPSPARLAKESQRRLLPSIRAMALSKVRKGRCPAFRATSIVRQSEKPAAPACSNADNARLTASSS